MIVIGKSAHNTILAEFKIANSSKLNPQQYFNSWKYWQRIKFGGLTKLMTIAKFKAFPTTMDSIARISPN